MFSPLVIGLVSVCIAADPSFTPPSLPSGPVNPVSTLGELKTHATSHSIGIEWDIAGDTNHNATCGVDYRVKGDKQGWTRAVPLFRIDFHGWYADRKPDRGYNMVAGSILFLKPGTEYEVSLGFNDPDGGSTTKAFTIATRPIPVRPAGGRTIHVIAGIGGGDGTKDNPIRGIRAAEAVALPGDVCVLGAGLYGDVVLNKSGTPEKRIGWVKGDNCDVFFNSVEVAASHLWIEGLSFIKDKQDTALRTTGPMQDDAIVRSTFRGFKNSITLSNGARDWYIADNDIEGANDPNDSTLQGEAIDLRQSEGHIVAHNRCSKTQCGVHYAKRNCDIFGNDIFDTTDDSIECDYGYANIRMWGNRCTNYHNNGISFQPMFCGPWYILYNQVVGKGSTFKFRVQDRFLLANNTFVTWSQASSRMHHLLLSLSRNNLYICGGKPERVPIWTAFTTPKDPKEHVRDVGFKPNWMTDVDYDGIDWGPSPMAVRWDKSQYKDLVSFADAVGIEKHAVAVKKEAIFEKWTLPNEPGRVDPNVVLTLKPGSNAVDAGAALPNVNEGFAGKAPDLGAHEQGKPPAVYGPRRK